jgi:hypothetical protein
MKVHIKIKMESAKTIESFCQELSKKFCVREADVLKFANEFWNLSMETNSFKIALNISRSRSNSQSNTPRSSPSTPRASNSQQDASSSVRDSDAFPQVASKVVKKKVTKEEKTNNCQYINKAGKNKGKPCGVACSGQFCSKHSSNQAATEEETPQKETQQKEQKEKEKGKAKVKAPLKIDELIESRTEHLQIDKNKWGNYQHTPTGLLYDPKSETIYGKQLQDGSIAELSLDDIEICKSFRVGYQLPQKLGEIATEQVLAQDDDYEEFSSDEEN